MVREQFHELFQGDVAWGPSSDRLAAKTFEFVEFLTKVLKVDLSGYALPEPTTVTYHYTCHQRGLGMSGESPALLKQLGNVNLVPLEKTDQCCGFGGTFAVKYPQISTAMAEVKCNSIAETKADYVVSNDLSCLMQIQGWFDKNGGRVMKSLHLAEVLNQR
jgi:L-lactate dehydrogenase complex protein LldE